MTAASRGVDDARPTPRVAYLTGEFPRATDTFIQREVAALRDLGFDIHTFAVRRPGPEHQVGPEQRALSTTTTYLLEGVKRPAVVSAHLGLAVRSPRRYLAAARLATTTRRAGLRGAIFQLFYFLEAGVLAAALHRRRVDHLHNHFGDSSCTVAMLASELSGTPYSFTLHGPGIFFDANVWRLDEKLRRAAFCACISWFARSQAIIFGGTEVADRLHVIHCGIDPDRLAPVEHRPDRFRLVYVGRLVELKGMSVLLQAMAEVAKHHPAVTLTVVGDGPDRDRFEAAAAAAGLASAVEFTGSVSQDEVARLLAEADTFVLPSFAEGVPVTLMEAMARSLPVVTTAVGGIAELVEDEVNGLLTRPGDPASLAEALERLADDVALRTRMGRAGRATVVEAFRAGDEAARLGGLIVAYGEGRTSSIRPEPLALPAPT
ncbi:MAG: glycosyltransferase [Actinomycetota bacterium]